MTGPRTTLRTARVHLDPEDTASWQRGGARIARRNLLWSMVAQHICFSVWSVWSVLVLFMPSRIYHIDAAGKFYLIATATLVGALARIPYTLAVARFGGRDWTVLSALLLLVPVALTLYCVEHPGTPYRAFVAVAALTGLGGGHFASSMANINAFFPARRKGLALGLDAWAGNIGVTVIQLAGLAVLATVGLRPELLCGIYLVLLACAAVGCGLFMDNLAVRSIDLRSLGRVLRFPESWMLAFLYTCAFGSFIGFGFAFGQILQINYLAAGQSPADATLHAAELAFIGPLVGSCTRPLGGTLADRFGGARVALATFASMTVAAAALVTLTAAAERPDGAVDSGSMPMYVLVFMTLFALTGLGNGSIYRMIPALFDTQASGALIGIAGACGALGGVLVNLTLRVSYQGPNGSATGAFATFLVTYVVCIAVTWLVFQRDRAAKPVRSTVPAVAAPRTSVGGR